MKKSTKIVFISIAAVIAVIIAALIISTVGMRNSETELYGLWEKENDDTGYTDTIAFGDDGSVLLIYGSDEDTKYEGTWEKGSSFAGTTKINITLDLNDGTDMTMYIIKRSGRFVLVSDKNDLSTEFSKISDLTPLDSTTTSE